MSGDESEDDNRVSDGADEGGDLDEFDADADTESDPGDGHDHDHEPETDPTGARADGSESREKGPNEKFCAECGAVINERAELCPECGVRQPGAESGESDERLVAGVLAIVLGGIGAHKFYIGKTGQGVVYPCFSWMLIPAVVGLIEGVIYLTKSDEEFREQYMAD